MKKFRVICADPPWPFRDSLPGKSNWRGAAKHYKLMTVTEICQMSKPSPAEDALLFLWRVSSMQEEAIAVCRAWGFDPVGEMVWRKLTSRDNPVMGMGRITRNGHESILIGRRGKPEIRDKSIRSIFSARVGVHSEKPEEFYKMVEQLTRGPYLELFARRERKGWTTMGDELDG